MKFRYRSFFSLIMLLPSFLMAQEKFQVSSPNGNIHLTVQRSAEGLIHYELAYKNQPVLEPSALGITFNKPETELAHFSVMAVDSSSHDDTWTPVWGEVNQIRNHYKRITLKLKSNGSGVLVNMEFRVFDDGLGFRYLFPEQPGLGYFVVSNELTEFNLTGDHKTFWIPGDYDSNEYSYNTTPLSNIDAHFAWAKEKAIAVTSPFSPDGVQTPLMMKTAEGLYINIHEAALVNYPAMDLLLDKTQFSFTSQLVPDAVGNKAYLKTPAQTPWRTVVVSDKATDIIASKMILNLNEPSKLETTDWIRPQKFVGVWWEMHTGKATWQMEGGKHGATTANVKKYIDFASLHHLDGVLVEGWNTGWEDWFGNWKEDVFDFVTPYPDYDVNEVTRYAKEKGVKIIMHHETSGSATNYERWMDSAYRFMVNHGMNSVKTGYVGKIIPRGEHHDGQCMVRHYVRVAEKTAQYHIMLDAHEPVRPTGLHRTYPNWMACEAARGMEFNNFARFGMLPDHYEILPFTRLMGGPMDFTPGIFHMNLTQFDPNRVDVRVRTTLAKQLALYVTMYSPLQMVADLPENYEKHLDAFQFIEEVPVDWDDTRVLEAEPGDYLTIVRKGKGTDDWWLGSITDENPRNMKIGLDFLEPGVNYEATIYRDSDKADWDKNPESYTIEKKKLNSKSKLDIKIAPGGGCAVSIKKVN